MKLAIIGLGYVGLPLAVAFGRIYPTIGYDIDTQRLSQLNDGVDVTLEMNGDEIKSSKHLKFSSDLGDLQDCNFYIVTVPTPINENKQPDLEPLLNASKLVGKLLKRGDIVIYESTVFPGATEDVCVPLLEQHSGLQYNKHFFCGYSPERINPGDKKHSLENICKITSGSTDAAAAIIDKLYSSIIQAGTFRVSSIKIAEAAKVIENTQRDVNIGLINELAMLFSKLQIDTQEVLTAACTKWNFLPFKPGLVGGHCIGVDPYYLTYKAQSVGYNPEIILAGRRINDNMGVFVSDRLIKSMLKQRIQIEGSKVLILGLAFKENCPDFRNTKVVDIILELIQYGIDVDCYDPWVEPGKVFKEFGFELVEELEKGKYDGVVIAVAHDVFIEMQPEKIKSFANQNSVIFDVKSVFPKNEGFLRL